MTREQEHRASEARRLCEDPLLNEALAALELDALNAILTATGDDADRVRREAADRINVIRGLKSHLKAIVLEAPQERPRGVA